MASVNDRMTFESLRLGARGRIEGILGHGIRIINVDIKREEIVKKAKS
jgi:hypothetical protein